MRRRGSERRGRRRKRRRFPRRRRTKDNGRQWNEELNGRAESSMDYIGLRSQQLIKISKG